MPKEQEVNYRLVRAVRVPKIQIDQIEAEYGVKLVPDSEYRTLLALDDTLMRYRLENEGKEPDLVMLRDQPEWLYKHMVLNIQFMGTEIPGSRNKPAWFRFKKSF